MNDAAMLMLTVGFFGVCAWVLLSKMPKMVKLLQEELREKSIKINLLTEENLRLSRIIHDNSYIASSVTPSQSAGDFVAPNQIQVKARVFVCYTDFHGEQTERQVDMMTCDPDSPDGYFTGFCHLKNDVRTFRINRVGACVDLDTGELISNFPQFVQNHRI